MKNIQSVLSLTVVLLTLTLRAAQPLAVVDAPAHSDTVIFDGKNPGRILTESNIDQSVLRAANDLAEDFARVTGTKASMAAPVTEGGAIPIIIGILGQSQIIDRLCNEGKVDVAGIRGERESYVLQVVAKPLPNIERALVIAGSDRRGAIYGIYQLSQMIGVSPWYWWADVPVTKHEKLALRGDLLKQGPPAVKYRGIFINDEDWGMYPWAARTFDPEFKNIGPKTYGKIFELMLRLRLNYLWPAMHAVSTEFGSVPENSRLADEYGVVMGSSHCEPMLYNNVKWPENQKGRWNYSLNRDTIYSTWEQYAKDRGHYEAVWTLGIRGIHDAGMERPPDDMPGKINLMGEVFRDQRELLNQYVTKQYGPVAQCFVPYKEVLPIYDAGLKVPDDVTLVWVDDNFGYIRRLSNPEERQRSGGAGIYWHLSYYGGPHSYTWINTTAPALMWEELHKAWENQARTLWVINVGDIKPMETGVDYFSRLAWNPEAFPLGAQRQYLHDFASANFGEKFAKPMADLLMDFYRLGTIRKPELMERDWALSLTAERAKELETEYQHLLDEEKSLAKAIPAQARDAYAELVGFPARVLGESGQIFMADRKVRLGGDASAGEKRIAGLRDDLEAAVGNYNTNLAGGKWNRMMPGLVTGRNLPAWNSQVRWPWGEGTNSRPIVNDQIAEKNWRNASKWDRATTAGQARWSVVQGLGPSGSAVVLTPVDAGTSWSETDAAAPLLQYNFNSAAGVTEAWVDFLPAFRLYPGMKLRVAVSVDQGSPQIIEIPGSNGTENENGQIRSLAVQNNYVRARISLNIASAGKHSLEIRAMDPGAVIDRIHLP